MYAFVCPLASPVNYLILQLLISPCIHEVMKLDYLPYSVREVAKDALP